MTATKGDIDGLIRVLFGHDPLGTVELDARTGTLEVNIFMSRAEYRGPMPRRYRGIPVHYEFGSDG